MPDEVSVRELRKHTAEVLRRVEAGERLRVTVDRRPVAELAPLPARDSWVPRRRVVASARRAGRRPRIQDTWIAATARAHGVPLYGEDGVVRV